MKKNNPNLNHANGQARILLKIYNAVYIMHHIYDIYIHTYYLYYIYIIYKYITHMSMKYNGRKKRGERSITPELRMIRITPINKN